MHPEGVPHPEGGQDIGRVRPTGRPADGPVSFGWAVQGGVAGGGYRGSRPLRAGRDDLRGAPFPLGDWGDPAARLEELYRWAEEGALRTADWYLADRLWKRRGARTARIVTVLGAGVAIGLPLLQLHRHRAGRGRAGGLGVLGDTGGGGGGRARPVVRADLGVDAGRLHRAGGAAAA